MTNNDLQQYIEATQQREDLQKQFDVLRIKLDGLQEKARQMIAPDNEAIFCLGMGNYYRVYLDGDNDIQVNPIRYI